MSDHPAACPHCGQTGEFDALGTFARRVDRLPHDAIEERFDRWSKFHCPDCGEVFALRYETVREGEDAGAVEGLEA